MIKYNMEKLSTAESNQQTRSVQSEFKGLLEDLSAEVLGQETLLNRMLIALLAEGHLLVVGAPGLAKTTAIKALARRIEGTFHRIQFTPDLLPSDLTGTDIYRPTQGDFKFQPGPLFHHFLLADEINRAPAKVQSALLEVMAEKQITVGQHTYDMPELFLVMATQNPIDHEGTYALPEAQLDRFLMEVKITYPDREKEQEILRLVRAQRRADCKAHDNDDIISQKRLFEARREVLDIHLSTALESYMVELVVSSRDPSHYDEKLKLYIQYGASPRGTIALEHCARAHAWLAGQDYVAPADIHAVAADVLRHRLILSYEALADGVSVEDYIERLLQLVPVP